MPAFLSLFSTTHPVIGMIHLSALPGTPKYDGNAKAIIRSALEESRIYLDAGIDGIAIENMHDIPYLKEEVGHEISSLMSIIGYEIKRMTDLPCGIQILSSANRAALAVAHNAGLDFVRAEGYVFGHLADEGYIDAQAGALLRYRRQIGAERIAILTDIKKKHSSHALTSDVSIAETAKAADFFLSDGLIVTGSGTGEVADIKALNQVREVTALPVIVGSGVTYGNVEQYLPVCDGMIVGSGFKDNGHWAGKLSFEKVDSFMKKVRSLRTP